ncbi:MAG: hypothetical protein KDB23_09300 [Planctomycetales bacterium]|nr:hypothetical protein [Planctomycetales bacterium]
MSRMRGVGWKRGMGGMREVDGWMPLANRDLTRDGVAFCPIETKSYPPRPKPARIWFKRSPRRRTRTQVVSLTLALIVGAWIPGFLPMLAVILAGLAASLGGFILFVQMPVAFIIRRWHARRLAWQAG